MRVRTAERIFIGVSPSGDGIAGEYYHIFGGPGKIILEWPDDRGKKPPWFKTEV
jgi:hypothetical protein